MTRFTVNKGDDYSEQSVEAYNYREEGSYITFYNSDGDQVLSLRKAGVASVTREEG
jgi:hypothetical protein